MTKTECHVWAGRMKNLHPVLRRWTELMSKTAVAWAPTDCAWWYTERPAVGLLASACWLEDGMALEEYGEEKKTTDGRTYSGRHDLYLFRKGVDYQIEAKHCWQRLDDPVSKLRRKLNDSLGQAIEDVRKIKEGTDHRIGVTFAVPYIACKYPPTALVAALQQWQDMLKAMDLDVLAWAFPPVGWKMIHTKNIFPGVALLGKSV